MIKTRGRRPGQLKGAKYNVPPRQQFSVSLLEEDLQHIDRKSFELGITRSKMISIILEDWVKNGIQARTA